MVEEVDLSVKEKMIPGGWRDGKGAKERKKDGEGEKQGKEKMKQLWEKTNRCLWVLWRRRDSTRKEVVQCNVYVLVCICEEHLEF